MKSTGLLAVRLAAMAALATAAEVVYVTDLPLYTQLAPCAASAVGYILQSQTSTNCPEAVSALQGCICTKNSNFASISKAVSSSVSANCGGTASEDQASVQTVLSAYCNQETVVSFPKPSVTVSQYITELAAIGDLAPCASSGLAYAVQSMSYTYCPEDVALFGPCVCGKNQNSLKVSQMINTYVKSYCSSHSPDITSAQTMFAAYCGMVSGTSSFPKPSDPPGDVSYYITALPQYSSLAPCAQSGVSYALFAQTYDFCPKGPKALASCACLKDGVFGSVSSTLTSNVKWNCGSTASEDVASGLAVLNYFCSAAKAEVTPAGVTESVSQSYGTAKSGSGSGASPKETGSSKPGSNGKPSDAAATGGASGSSSGGNSSSSSRTPVIIGAVVGVVGGIALIGTAAFCVMRHVRKKRAAAEITPFQPPNYPGSGPGSPPVIGKPELAGAAIAAGMAPSPSPSAQKQNAWAGADDVSPLSGNNSAYPPASPHTPVPGYPNSAYGPPAPELHGQPVHEFPAQMVYQADSQPVQPQRAELQGMGWQSGPVSNNYAELDGGQHWRGEPHAR